MDFLKLVRARYSVRQYQNRPVEPEKVEQLLEGYDYYPSTTVGRTSRPVFSRR